ncbi:MAG: FxsA family protein [SAR86 cluster bacterium]|nr:FxsA family protein [SAR86 cluster bacterium]
MKYFLPSFIVLPILEMYILIEVGGFIGALNTIGLVLLTALLGLILIRQQGFRTLLNARNKLMQAELPTEELVTGIFLAVGGALLLTPGFVTDFIGFMCLLPFTRSFLMSLIATSFFDVSGFSQKKEEKQGNWIEGEYKKDE